MDADKKTIALFRYQVIAPLLAREVEGAETDDGEDGGAEPTQEEGAA